MSIEKVKEFLKPWGMEKKVLEFHTSSATVALAAAALGTTEDRIAKTLALSQTDGAVVIVMAGDVKIDNQKYKAYFGQKAKMLSPEQTLEATGHAVGGVCPFALPSGVRIYLDQSLKRFETVYPACGSANSAVALTPEMLERITAPVAWIDVTKAK